jgi:transposase
MFQRPISGHLSLQQKGGIIALHQNNVPTGEIAQRVGCNRNTVSRWIKNYRDNFDVLRRVGSGRPRKTMPAQDAKIFQAIRAKPITTLQEVICVTFFSMTTLIQ